MAKLRPKCLVYLNALADRLTAGQPIPEAERGARLDQAAAGWPRDSDDAACPSDSSAQAPSAEEPAT